MYQQDPMLTLMDALGGRNPSEALENAERAGQAALAGQGKDCELPIKHSDAWEVLERAGVKKLGDARDALFRRASLPAGWKIKATSHAMWSELLDDKGRKRASIFYKAAFYDRDAFMTPERRYQIESFYNDDSDTFAVARVTDQGKVLFESERFELKTKEDCYGAWDPKTHEPTVISKRDVVKGQCAAWLEKNFPEWKDASAYWD